MGVCQREIVNLLISTGNYSSDMQNSLKTQVNFALNGTRVGKRYIHLLKEIDNVLDNNI